MNTDEKPDYGDEPRLNTRERLEKELEGPLREGIWETLKGLGFIDQYEGTDPYGLGDLASDYRQIDQNLPANNFAQKGPPKTPVRIDTDDRGRALAEILGHYVDTMPAVMDFRKKYLKRGSLKTDEQVDVWIAKKAKIEECERGGFIFINDWYNAHGYVYPDIEAKRGGALEALDHAAKAIYRNLSPVVDRRVSIICVMTGRVELTRIVINWNINHLFRALNRITLTVDPRLTPAEVAEAYKAQRDRFATWLFGGAMRGRPMSGKMLRLAVFVDREYREGRTWADLLEAWNETCKDPEDRHGVDLPGNFTRDAKRAWERVTGSSWGRRQQINERVANDPFWKLELKKEEQS